MEVQQDPVCERNPFQGFLAPPGYNDARAQLSSSRIRHLAYKTVIDL